MVGSPRITWTLAAILAVRLLQTASAEVAEEVAGEVCTPTSVKGAGDYEDCAPSQKRGTDLLQTAKRASLAQKGQSERGPGFCWEKESTDGKQSACWANKPQSDTPACTPDSGKTVCRCETPECRWDLLDKPTPTTAFCKKKFIYVVGGVYNEKRYYTHKFSRKSGKQAVAYIGEFEISGTSLEMYCLDMEKNTEYHDRHIIKREDDRADRIDKGSITCYLDWDYKWIDSENGCFRSKRYLGDKCWFPNGGGDRCEGGSDVTCHDGTCIPTGFDPPVPCECKSGNDALVCNSNDCGPSRAACVMNFLDGDKGRYCEPEMLWYP